MLPNSDHQPTFNELHFATVSLWGLQFIDATLDQVSTTVGQYLNAPFKKTLSIFTPNPEQIVQAQRDAEFFNVLQQGDILLPDGVGIIWASHWKSPHKLIKSQKKSAPDEASETKPTSLSYLSNKLPGVNMAQALMSQPEVLGQTVLVIGGKDYQGTTLELLNGEKVPVEEVQASNIPEAKSSEKGVSEKAAFTAEQFFGSKVFWTPGYASVQHPTSTEEIALKKIITQLKPALVFVAFGAPWQEKWVHTHLSFLDQQKVKVVMVIGGGIDALTGKTKRAPQGIQQLGLEWLFRLLHQPWRWKRQLRLLTFVKMVVLGE